MYKIKSLFSKNNRKIDLVIHSTPKIGNKLDCISIKILF